MVRTRPVFAQTVTFVTRSAKTSHIYTSCISRNTNLKIECTVLFLSNTVTPEIFVTAFEKT